MTPDTPGPPDADVLAAARDLTRLRRRLAEVRAVYDAAREALDKAAEDCSAAHGAVRHAEAALLRLLGGADVCRWS